MSDKQYPIGGYAPGSYHNRCVTCERSFFGDKRAVQCEPCATKALRPSESAGVNQDIQQKIYNILLNHKHADRTKAAEEIAQLFSRESAGASAVWVKGEYDRMYDQVKRGIRTVCYVDYKWSKDDPTPEPIK